MANEENHNPEFILQDGDTSGITIKKMKFYQEDIEKMSKMSLDEMMTYKAQLIEDEKYTYEEE